MRCLKPVSCKCRQNERKEVWYTCSRHRDRCTGAYIRRTSEELRIYKAVKGVAEFAEKNSARNLEKYDAYLLLTEAMNSVVNKNGKPYIVLEGHCDSKMEQRENNLSDKSQPKIAMYAGGIHKEFGIERLVNAFVRGGFSDWELHIYGDGKLSKGFDRTY